MLHKYIWQHKQQLTQGLKIIAASTHGVYREAYRCMLQLLHNSHLAALVKNAVRVAMQALLLLLLTLLTLLSLLPLLML